MMEMMQDLSSIKKYIRNHASLQQRKSPCILPFLIICCPYDLPHLIGISFFRLSVVSYNRPEGETEKDREDTERGCQTC